MLRPTAMLPVTASLATLSDVRRFVASTATDFGLEVDAVADVVQAVDEAVTNIVMHGYRHHPGPIGIEMVLEAAELIVRLSDEAPSFDPTAAPNPNPASHSDPISGGWGIQIMRRLTDRMSYRVLSSGGNELTLVKTVVTHSP